MNTYLAILLAVAALLTGYYLTAPTEPTTTVVVDRWPYYWWYPGYWYGGWGNWGYRSYDYGRRRHHHHRGPRIGPVARIGGPRIGPVARIGGPRIGPVARMRRTK
jgi:hypothetical protein